MPSKSRRYPWPASRIDVDVMHELHLASQRTGLPITHLISDAVHAAMNDAMQRPQQVAPIGFVQPQQKTVA